MTAFSPSIVVGSTNERQINEEKHIPSEKTLEDGDDDVFLLTKVM